jgi:hypothetical protein
MAGPLPQIGVMRHLRLVRAIPCLLLVACAAAPPRDAALPPAGGAGQPAPLSEQRAFWDGLQELCGNAYAGAPVHLPAADTLLAAGPLVMHVSECSENEIRIPFHVGEDRSRTWVLRRVAGGLEMKHIHRHRDGTESSNTNYGGTTSARGTPHRQEFPADAVSVAAVPVRATQWWFFEHYPGHRFAYGLFRDRTASYYRLEFDLTRTVPPPPPAW